MMIGSMGIVNSLCGQVCCVWMSCCSSLVNDGHVARSVKVPM
jgi:hypothetical protein